jgi:hypothetical protein
MVARVPHLVSVEEIAGEKPWFVKDKDKGEQEQS